MVAGEPLRRVGAPTPRLLRSPPLAKVQSHSHHLLRQVLFAYLAVPPCLVELVVIAILHHSLLHCVERRAQPLALPPYPAPQRRKIRARSHTRKQAQTAAAIWQAARWGRESAAVRARSSVLPLWTRTREEINKVRTGPQRSWEEDRRKRRGVERLCIPPGAPLRRGGVVGG